MIMFANYLPRVKSANFQCKYTSICIYTIYMNLKEFVLKLKKRRKSYEIIPIYALQFVPVFKASSLNRCNRRKSRNQFLRSKLRLFPYNLLSEIYFAVNTRSMKTHLLLARLMRKFRVSLYYFH